MNRDYAVQHSSNTENTTDVLHREFIAIAEASMCFFFFFFTSQHYSFDRKFSNKRSARKSSEDFSKINATSIVSVHLPDLILSKVYDSNSVQQQLFIPKEISAEMKQVISNNVDALQR